MKKLINRLKALGYHISAAESCTGGLVSKLLTDVSGASEVFDCAVTTYSNEAKMKLLGVKKETLDVYGAVSEECAKEMASGVLALSHADIAVSVTGLAGPNGDGSGLPVGTVCIGVATKDKVGASTFVFAGSRTQIRKLSAKMACQLVFDELGVDGKNKSVIRKKSKKTIDKKPNR
ncbi:MAG: nicotinamide-nucleotide amidohydrolase family protein [Clostridiales bacterium]|nr:nicotinamide-nucleotide amidohydrolase family protein [Candidatus Coliplasma equi]